MMSKVFAGSAALGLALCLFLSVPAAAEEPDPPCGRQFPASVFGPLELGTMPKPPFMRPSKRAEYSGVWRVGRYWDGRGEAATKWLELKSYKGRLPYGLARGDSIKTVRRKLAAHFTSTGTIKSEADWPWHDRVFTSMCRNKLGTGQRFEVAFRKGVMFAVLVASDYDIYERDYPE